AAPGDTMAFRAEHPWTATRYDPLRPATTRYDPPRPALPFLDMSTQPQAPNPGAFQPPWLRGPMAGVPALLQPVAHALVDAVEDVQKVVPPLSAQEIAARPGGAAPIAYHVTHAIGSLDRLFTYARGESLTALQMATLTAA